MPPRRKTSAMLYDEAMATFEAAVAEARVENAESESRIARLKLAAELEGQGRQKEADKIIREVEREQERL